MIGGRYSLDRRIGRGGMGSVWLGVDEVLGRPVALKRVGMMPDGSSPDLMRAEREARIAASLNHPHVVGVFDLVIDGDEQWLVMEHVEGTTLADMVRTRGPLPPDEVRRVLGQTAQALAAAHDAGIVHRDVKPSNILVRHDGEVKLSDFGIARAVADASLTRTGLVTGSPAYLAPEVASGQQATPASDVWSLGATAFHALAGHPPYDVGDNVLGAMYRIVNEPPPRLSPGALSPLVDATMVTDPAGRWSTAQVLAFLGAPATPAARLAPLAVPSGRRAAPAPGQPEPTVLAPATASVPVPVPHPAPVLPATPPPPGAVRPAPEPVDRSPHRTPPRRGRALPALVALLVVALVVAIVLIARQDDPQRLDPSATGQPAARGTDSGTSAPAGSGNPTPSPTPTPDAGDMADFVRGYLATADRDPGAAYAELTPTYQQRSGGEQGYLGFWDEVSGVALTSEPVADPASLTVTYSYVYTRRGQGRQTDTVTLLLAFDAASGSYLIAGEPQ